MALRVSFVALMMIVCGCSFGPVRVVTPLPRNLKVTPPEPGTTKDIAGLSGIWVGHWDGGSASTLVVEKIEGSSATVVYSWGENPDFKLKAGFKHLQGRINPDGSLYINLGGPEILYKLSADQKHLSGEYSWLGDVTHGAFQHPDVPAH